jgi:hypothetical protein
MCGRNKVAGQTCGSPVHVPQSQAGPSLKRKNRDGTSSIILCPAAVADYNAIMGGLDRFDQRRGYMQLGGAHSNCDTV